MERDFQKAKVYRWEWEHIYGKDKTKLNLEQCQALADKVLAECGMEPFKVVETEAKEVGNFGFEAYIAQVSTFWRTIELPEPMMVASVIIHECAHAVAELHTSGYRPQHGITFVKVYIDLLVRYAGLDRQMLLDTAKAAKIRVGRYETPSGEKAARSFELLTQLRALDSEQDDERHILRREFHEIDIYTCHPVCTKCNFTQRYDTDICEGCGKRF